MDRRKGNEGWSAELERKSKEMMMAEHRARSLWPYDQQEGGKTRRLLCFRHYA
jgi:hypothetical protein